MIKDRCEFGKLLNGLELTDIAVEVGVHRGEFSRMLLDVWKGEGLYLVDPWKTLDGYTDPLNKGDREADRLACAELLECYAGRWMALRMTSVDASEGFETGTFDFIYIDADHEEAAVRQDLELWYPKLKHGGVFAGHDFFSTVAWPGVWAAVNEFAAKRGIKTINVTQEPGGSWWWVKP
jgi:hypothetical protein